jgi:hypothetical protein
MFEYCLLMVCVFDTISPALRNVAGASACVKLKLVSFVVRYICSGMRPQRHSNASETATSGTGKASLESMISMYGIFINMGHCLGKRGRHADYPICAREHVLGGVQYSVQRNFSYRSFSSKFETF